MAVVQMDGEKKEDAKRQVSSIKFPYYSLGDSVLVAQTIHQRSGGAATVDEIAAHLNYGGIDNGAFKSRMAAAKSFGLISKSNEKFVLTQLAQGILMPVYDWMPKENLVNAFLSVELFKRVYEEYKGKQLPPDFGMKNALKNMFGVGPAVVEKALRVLMESAATAGFFDTRAGARTHLIIPTITKGAATVPEQNQEPDAPAHGGGSGGSTNGGGDAQHIEGIEGARKPLPPATSLDAVKARYVQSLLNVFEEKSKKGELDNDLMTRIEKLLSVQ